MRWQMMSVFDAAVENYSPPFCVRAIGEAIRTFSKEVKTEGSRIAASPKDYTLFHLGEYDDETGIVHMLTAPRKLVSGHEVDPLS